MNTVLIEKRIRSSCLPDMIVFHIHNRFISVPRVNRFYKRAALAIDHNRKTLTRLTMYSNDYETLIQFLTEVIDEEPLHLGRS